jgi:hypothetical protein
MEESGIGSALSDVEEGADDDHDDGDDDDDDDIDDDDDDLNGESVSMKVQTMNDDAASPFHSLGALLLSDPNAPFRPS